MDFVSCLHFRYTPLDYALMGEHEAVAQYMIEQGALSITGIQDIAACKIQASVVFLLTVIHLTEIPN